MWARLSGKEEKVLKEKQMYNLLKLDEEAALY